MNTKALKVINLLLLIDFLLLGITAILNNRIQAAGLYYFVHAVPGFVFLALAATHLFLNRKWIKASYLSKRK